MDVNVTMRLNKVNLVFSSSSCLWILSKVFLDFSFHAAYCHLVHFSSVDLDLWTEDHGNFAPSGRYSSDIFVRWNSDLHWLLLVLQTKSMSRALKENDVQVTSWYCTLSKFLGDHLMTSFPKTVWPSTLVQWGTGSGID